ncbi:MAG: hypothetical protein IPH44_26740 [Myxococcales bacterium]|nr:hypothetical protein [Myxococcales bacterium]
MRLERGQLENAVRGRGWCAQLELGRGLGALEHHAEQQRQALVQVGAGPLLVGREIELLERAQAVEAVALGPRLDPERRPAELGAGLDVEQEQQPVHVAHALAGQLGGAVLGEQLLVASPELTHRLVAQRLDALAQGVLEVLGHREGVLV